MPKTTNIECNQITLIKVLKNIYKESLKQNINKKTTGFFYCELPESFSNDEIKEVDKVFNYLFKNKYIDSYKNEVEDTYVNEDDLYDEAGFLLRPAISEWFYHMKYEFEFTPKKIIKLLEAHSVIPKYFIRIHNEKSEKILVLNNQYLLSKPHYGSPAYNLIEVLEKNSNKKLTKGFIEKEIQKNNNGSFAFERRLISILTDLKFTKELKKTFFPHTSEEAIYFKKDILLKDIKEYGVDMKKLNAQIKTLKPYKGEHRNSLK